MGGLGIIEGAFDLGGQALENEWAKDRQAQAQAFSAEQYAKRYQTATADMKAAGINPMMMSSQGPGSAPTSSAASKSGSLNLGNIINQTKIANAQEANLEANTEKAKQDANVSQQQAKNIAMDTLVKEGMPKYYAALVNEAQQSAEKSAAMTEQIRKVEIPKTEQEIKNLKVALEKDKSNIQLNQALTAANQQLAILRTTEQHLNNAKIDVVQKEGQILSPKAKAAGMATGQGAAIAENVWKIITPPNPFSGGGNMSSKYPKRVKD